MGGETPGQWMLRPGGHAMHSSHRFRESRGPVVDRFRWSAAVYRHRVPSQAGKARHSVSLVHRLLPVDGDRRRIARPHTVTKATVYEHRGPRDLAGAPALRRRSIRLFVGAGWIFRGRPATGAAPERVPVDRVRARHGEAKGGTALSAISRSGVWNHSPAPLYLGQESVRHIIGMQPLNVLGRVGLRTAP
jgi:hypothetical protein